MKQLWKRLTVKELHCYTKFGAWWYNKFDAPEFANDFVGNPYSLLLLIATISLIVITILKH